MLTSCWQVVWQQLASNALNFQFFRLGTALVSGTGGAARGSSIHCCCHWAMGVVQLHLVLDFNQATVSMSACSL